MTSAGKAGRAQRAVRFIHTADLQLGMTRRFLDEDAQARFAQARIDSLVTIGRVAAEQDAAFVVVAGDVFETNRVRARTVTRALEAMASVKVPVYLLPGNHDPVDAATVYRSPTFESRKPQNVHVLDSFDPVEVIPSVQVIGAPWPTKRPLRDLVGVACAAQDAAQGGYRIVVGHGAIDTFNEHPNPAAIRLAEAEAAILDGRVHYIALGDRHSTTNVGATGRIWYAGAPEPTAHDETDAGNILLVELAPERCTVSRMRTGGWTFVDGALELDRLTGADPVQPWLDAVPGKDRAIVRLTLTGSISISQQVALRRVISEARETFGSVEEWETHRLTVRPDDDDFSDLALAGFAKAAVARLRVVASGANEAAETAREALAVLVGLAGDPSR